MVFRFKIIILLFFYSFTDVKWVKKEKEFDDAVITVFESTKKEKYKNYVIIVRGEGKQKDKLDSIIKKNLVYYQNNYKNNIKLVVNKTDTILPNKYIFEDNISGILPYYKFLVSFEEKKKIINKELIIKVLEKDRIIN
jgi:hypothetical protein